jgi:hypothetical protein
MQARCRVDGGSRRIARVVIGFSPSYHMVVKQEAPGAPHSLCSHIISFVIDLL